MMSRPMLTARGGGGRVGGGGGGVGGGGVVILSGVTIRELNLSQNFRPM